MSIYGSLFSGVSGLRAQGTNMGVISDNISNLNTVGYKASEATFETLVNNAPGTISYNPGGVLASVRQFTDKQGLLQATDSPTDIALSGGGMFVVNPASDGSGETLYTRAGSFRQDALGNFVNTSGYYLQGWPLDRDGRLPGEPGNLNTTAFSTLASLETVNIEFSNGVAAATTTVEIGANLDARTNVYAGAGREVAFATANNQNIASDAIIVEAGGLTYGDTVTVTTDQGLIYNYEFGGYAASADVTGGIFGATSTTQTFFTAGTAPTGADADFIINTPALGDVTFTYKQTQPSTTTREFNNLQTLAAAINDVVGLTARIDGNFLYVASEDAQEAVTFSDGGATGWVAALDDGGADGFAAGIAAAAANPRFNSLQSLADEINDNSNGLTAVLENPTGQSVLTIRTDDPLGTIQFTDDTAGPPANSVAVLEMGLVNDLDPTPAFLIEDTFGPEYDPSASGSTMAQGNVQPQFSRNIRVFDALGTGHNLTVGFLKTATNQWAVEIWAADEDDINGSLVGDQIATGNIVFNGDGTLRSVDTSLLNPINIQWLNGAVASSITFDWGTAGLPSGTENATVIGDADGMSQFASDNNVAFVDQNGAEVGSLISVSIDDLGFVYANFTNGESQALYKLPVADFQNVNGLEHRSGNVWFQTQDSGPLNLRFADTNGVGKVVSGVLENSNVELADELTNMIIAQRSYQSNAKVISTSDELLEELNRL